MVKNDQDAIKPIFHRFIKIEIDFSLLRCSVWRNSNQIVLFLFRKSKIFAGFHENEKPTHPLFTTTPPSPPSSSIVVDTAHDVDQFKSNLGSALKLEGSDRNEILTRKNLRHKKRRQNLRQRRVRMSRVDLFLTFWRRAEIFFRFESRSSGHSKVEAKHFLFVWADFRFGLTRRVLKCEQLLSSSANLSFSCFDESLFFGWVSTVKKPPHNIKRKGGNVATS